MGALSNVEVQRTDIEAHSSLSLGERYHQPLRNTYRKIMCELPKCNPRQALAACVKAVNNTLRPERLVPLALVFVEFPKVVTPSEEVSVRTSLRKGL